MDVDLAVVGRDPLFGGGGLKQTDAFLDAARALGRTPHFCFDQHPGLRGPRGSWRRVEALRAGTASHRVCVPAAPALWVVSTHAHDGTPALHTGRTYSCWIGTTVDDEWAGRRAGLHRTRRALAGSSLRVLRVLERRVLHGAAAVYATSESSAAAVAAAAGRAEVPILRIPVDTDHFVPAPEEAWRATLDAPTVVFVGRATDPRKNVNLLLEVARRVPTVRVLLVGAPPLGDLPANVEAAGRVDDVAPYLRRGTLFVLPSLQEGFGIVAAEALASGLPVLTTPSGGPESLIRESGGGGVLTGFDPDEFGATITRLLAAPDELAELRRRGRAYVERHHSRAVFESALAAALEERRA